MTKSKITYFIRDIVCGKCHNGVFKVQTYTKNKPTGKVHISIICTKCKDEVDLT